MPSRDAYGLALLEIAGQDERVVALTADLASSVRMVEFKQAFPTRMFNMGIAEQNMMGVSAGMALTGKIPFVSTFAVFASLRSAEQARTDVAYNNLPVRIVASHGGFGLAVGGATHHALEDVAIFRDMPNMTVIVPADSIEAAAATKAMMAVDGPVYMRVSRPKEPTVYTEDFTFEIGKAKTVREGSDIAIIAYGGSVGYSMKAAELLAADGIQARVVNMSTVKPIDRAAIVDAARACGKVMTVEEHNIYGGLGSAVAEVLAEESLSVSFKRYGVQDVFTTAAPYPDLLAYYGLDGAGIAKTVKEFLQ
ncbi:MAG: transketolase C-terminal domain-containing protein [Anaerolineaceae bacterium]|nr:transketolase C-terminal domain-containing protein [Anaerolineaceae bacterium]